MVNNKEEKLKQSKIGRIKPVEISGEMKRSYLDYAMSVIVARALPDVKDGLKPVHRRLLYAMHKMGLDAGSKYTKSAKIVGETMGKYHPHGDTPIYEALVRLAQDFSMRYPLIDGQGNFGSVDGDSPAAMRYTEARLAKIASEMLADIEKQTVDFVDNFDGTLKEPKYLPAKLPNLLLAGSDGIAVGVATKIPPHNLSEVVKALVSTIDKVETVEANQFSSKITIDELLKCIKGPDFPTGGLIYDFESIREVYATGRGKIPMRAKTRIEEGKRGKFSIIIEEIPFQVNKAKLVAKIADLVKNKKIVGIAALRDESDKRGMRVVIELKKNVRPKTVLNRLFKFTEMQTIYPANMVALVDGTPQTLNLKEVLEEFIKHRQKVVTRRTKFELEKAHQRVHILEGLMIALKHLDAIITTIKRAKDANIAKERLMKKFNLSEIQAQAILEMRLRQLARLEREKIQAEYSQLSQQITYLSSLLEDPKKILAVIKKEFLELDKKYGDERRTKVFAQPLGEFSERELIPSESCIVTLTKGGYIKRLPPNVYRTQRRGGKGVTGMKTKEEDEVLFLQAANTHDAILFFTNKGRVFKLMVFDLPETDRTAKGQAIINLINIEQDEKIQSVLVVSKDLKQKKEKFLFMATKKGIVKKTNLKEYQNIRSSGLIAIKLLRGDELCWTKITNGNHHIMLVTREGKSIRFNENDVRPTQRDTIGVMGIRLKKGDKVVAMEAFSPINKRPKDKRKKFFRDLLVVMDNGYGKRSALKEYPLQKRGGLGVKVANITPKTGKVVAAKLVNQKVKNIVLTSKKGQVIKLPLKNIPTLKRDTQGVILMRFAKTNDTVAALTCLEK